MLVFAALICPALCGQAAAAEEPCCPHSEPAPTQSGDGSRHDDPCQIAPCFCGGALALPRDESIAIQPLTSSCLVAVEPDAAISVFEADRNDAYWPSPPMPPDALSSLPLLI